MAMAHLTAKYSVIVFRHPDPGERIRVNLSYIA